MEEEEQAIIKQRNENKYNAHRACSKDDEGNCPYPRLKHLEQKFSKTEMVAKPWRWQKKVYESMIEHLDGAIDKCQDLSNKVEIDKMMKKYDEVMNQAHEEQSVSNVIPMVAEEAEKQYGAETFEKSDALKQSKEAVEISIKQKEKKR